MANMHQYLKAMIEKGASDLHITTGTAPQLRIDGKLHPLKVPPLSAPETKQLCYSVLTDAQKHQFEERNELDLSFSVQRLSRFRANIFVQRGNIAGAQAELAKLPPADRASTEAWTAKVQARDKALDASRRLAADAVAALNATP